MCQLVDEKIEMIETLATFSPIYLDPGTKTEARGGHTCCAHGPEILWSATASTAGNSLAPPTENAPFAQFPHQKVSKKFK